ncbi:hypothetical protein N0V83_000834 [Neocucurbitaria cava]|uniref:Uncharacterized protein n=1 Tax=Neocucurbitaria cava TaxID=798079 RepID=A0A9W8YI18_9PLEO|nr:hypothetical protein N0V83_000834 [Neocucurbitaria cava]
MAHQQPFRLLDLPGEIRNRIYHDVLCAFEQTSTPVLTALARILRQEPEPNGINQVSHATETTILRTCRTVHREAYDIMVKSNKFIRIRVTNPGLSGHLVRTQMPVVTMDRAHVAQFSGYVMQLDMHLDAHPDEPTTYPLLDFMILGRDWETFCNYFTTLTKEETYSKIRISFNPGATNLADYKAPLSSPFLEKAQISFLHTFRAHARDLRSVEITGPVAPTLVASVIKDVSSNSSLNTNKILSEMQDMHHLATQLFAANNTVEASSTWSLINPLIARLIRHPGWSSSPRTLAKVHKFNFKAPVNIAKCYLRHLRAPPTHLSPSYIVMLGFGALGYYTTALRAVNNSSHSYSHMVTAAAAAQGRWRPSTAAMVNLMVEACECRRLLAQTERKYATEEWLEEIESMLAQASRLAPEDQDVAREAREFWEWKTVLLWGG